MLIVWNVVVRLIKHITSSTQLEEQSKCRRSKQEAQLIIASCIFVAKSVYTVIDLVSSLRLLLMQSVFPCGNTSAQRFPFWTEDIRKHGNDFGRQNLQNVCYSRPCSESLEADQILALFPPKQNALVWTWNGERQLLMTVGDCCVFQVHVCQPVEKPQRKEHKWKASQWQINCLKWKSAGVYAAKQENMIRWRKTLWHCSASLSAAAQTGILISTKIYISFIWFFFSPPYHDGELSTHEENILDLDHTEIKLHNTLAQISFCITSLH